MAFRFIILIITSLLSTNSIHAQTSTTEQLESFTFSDLKKIDATRDLKQPRIATFASKLSSDTLVIKQGTDKGWAQAETFRIFKGKHFLGRGVVIKAEADHCVLRLQGLAAPIDLLLGKDLLFRPFPTTEASLELLLGKSPDTASVNDDPARRIHFGKDSPQEEAVIKNEIEEKNEPRKPVIKISLSGSQGAPVYETIRNDSSKNEQIRSVKGGIKIENADKTRYEMNASYGLAEQKQKRWDSTLQAHFPEKSKAHNANANLEVKDIGRTRFFYFTAMEYAQTKVGAVYQPRAKWQGTPAGVGYVLVDVVFKKTDDILDNFTIVPKFSPWLDYEATQVEAEGVVTETRTTTLRYAMAIETSFTRGPFTISDVLTYRPAYNSQESRNDWIKDAPLENNFSFKITQGNITFAYNNRYLWDKRNPSRGSWIIKQDQSFSIMVSIEI